MTATVAESMTANPRTIGAHQSVREAAQLMKAHDIGDVVVMDGDQVVGIVTDRDIVVRCLAEGGGGDDEISKACSTDVVTVESDARVAEAVKLMRDNAVRRVPVTEGGALVGIVSIGDLAVDLDPSSALADISAEPPNS